MISDADFTTIAREVKARSGAVLTPSMSGAIEIRLQPLARREGFTTIGDYIAAARSRIDGAMWSAITDHLAQSETRFFRDRGVMALLKNEILPQMQQHRGGERVRIWSAACSTGQEPYSIAMSIDELNDSGANIGADLFATDLSERLIDKAQSGLYTQFEVQRGLPVRKLIAHFERAHDLWRISDRMRAAIRFEQFNLMKHPGTLGQFDIVMLAHVLPSFDSEMQRGVIGRIGEILSPTGVIVLGEGETAPDGCENVHCAGGVIRKRQAARAAA